jgi:uncharacterized membrane protein (DUF2068 family)
MGWAGQRRGAEAAYILESDPTMSTLTHSRAGRVRISTLDKWLVVIGALKLCEAALFIALGVGVLRMLHKDLVDELTRLLIALHSDPEGRFSSLLLDKVALLDPHRLKEISAAIFAHAGLDILEGAGLVLRKTWAEFVTVAISAFFLPFEFMALAHRVTLIRVGVTAGNVAVVIYLIFHLRMKLRERRLAEG